jgi:hypothetical protein
MKKPAEWAGFVLCFKISRVGRVNLTFFADLYLPLFEGDGVDL